MSIQFSTLEAVLIDSYRLTSLKKTNLLDAPPERSFDSVIENISRKLNVPIAAMTLIEPHRQFFKSQTGIDARENDIKYSLCQYVVHEGSPIAISNATESDFHDHLAVTELGIKSYLGVPLLFERVVIGTLCVADTKPRQWSQADIMFLQNQATMIRFELFVRDKTRKH